MNRQTKPAQKNNLRMVVIFLIGVLVLLGISLCFKVITIAVNSTFDGAHTFILGVYPYDKHIKKVTLLSYAPDRGSIAVLRVANVASVAEAGKRLEVPIDGYIGTNNTTLFANDFGEDKEAVLAETKKFLMQGGNTTNNTFIDMLRLLLYANSVSSHTILSREVALPLDDTSLDKVSFFLFADQTISQEKASIAIINGTGIPGLGNRLARFISNMGGNVVSVSTADDILPTSTVAVSKEKLYTADRIAHVLSFPLEHRQEQSVAEITISIGKDKTGALVF